MANDAARGLQNTVAYRWEFVDLTEANAATGLTAADVGKLARFDDFSLWILTDDSPVTWKDLGSGADLAAHLADTTDAHDASAISFTPAGTIAATTVQAAIEEVASEAAGGGGGSSVLEGQVFS